VLENKSTTNCKNCVFSVKTPDNTKQIGCLAHRISKFRESGISVVTTVDNDESYYTIGGLCNLLRDKSWPDYQKAKDSNQLDREAVYLYKAKQEIATSFGFVIYDKEKTSDKLKNTINSVISTEYKKNKIKMVVSATGNKDDISEYIKVIEDTKSKGWNIELVLNAAYSPKHIRDFDAFNRCAGFHYLAYCDSGDIVSESTFDRINISLNHDLEKNITFSQSSKSSVVGFVMKRIANMEYLKHNDFHKMFEHIKLKCIEKNMHKEL
jgi:hypothetical protein